MGIMYYASHSGSSAAPRPCTISMSPPQDVSIGTKDCICTHGGRFRIMIAPPGQPRGPCQVINAKRQACMPQMPLLDHHLPRQTCERLLRTLFIPLESAVHPFRITFFRGPQLLSSPHAEVGMDSKSSVGS
eukprot:scaffold196642_cov37-Prasinocladus_malaysianus.AAC.2